MWENGKRVRWFEQDEIDAIEETQDSSTFQEHFANPGSANLIPKRCSFGKPVEWDEEIAKVRQKLDVPFE